MVGSCRELRSSRLPSGPSSSSASNPSPTSRARRRDVTPPGPTPGFPQEWTTEILPSTSSGWRPRSNGSHLRSATGFSPGTYSGRRRWKGQPEPGRWGHRRRQLRPRPDAPAAGAGALALSHADPRPLPRQRLDLPGGSVHGDAGGRPRDPPSVTSAPSPSCCRSGGSPAAYLQGVAARTRAWPARLCRKEVLQSCTWPGRSPFGKPPNSTSSVVSELEAGEKLTLTVNRRPVAGHPPSHRRA